MSFQLVPFESDTFSLAVANPEAFALNVQAEEFASVKFPVISIKNSRFHIKREGEKTLITRPKTNPTDPDEPASYIDMLVLNLQKAKSFYLEGYVEGSEDKPDCFSNDGITPDTSIAEPQCSTCQLCPNNVWGTGRNEKGEATKGKACSDVLRLAVVSPANLDDPYLLRVPPASLKYFAEVSKFLSQRNIPINRAIIRIGFDVDKTGLLTFKAIGGVDIDTFNKAVALMNSDLVLSITGKNNSPALRLAHTAAPALEHKPEAVAEAKPAKASKTPKTVKAEPTAEEKAAAEKAAKRKALLKQMEALDEEEKNPAAAKTTTMGAATATTPVPATISSPTPVVQSANFDAELAQLLA